MNCRILMVLTEFPPRIGGMQTHADQLSRRLAAEGLAIEVLTYQPGDPEEDQAARNLDGSYPFPVRRCLSRLGFWHNLETLQGVARGFRPDLIYASTVFYGLLGAEVGVPMVARSVGNDILRPWIAYPFRLGSGWLGQPWLERRLFNWFKNYRWPEWVEILCRRRRLSILEGSARRHARVLANSTFTADLLRALDLADTQIEVLPGGVDAQAFAPRDGGQARFRRDLGLPLDGPVFLSACRFVPKKGLEILLHAFREVCRRLSGAHLAVAGDGPFRTSCQALARSLGLEARTTFAGKVPHSAMPPWFWAADAFVLASREHVHHPTGLRDVETMGRVLCEANAAGVPLVATRSGGIPGVVRDGHNGLLVPPNDPSALGSAMCRLLEDGGLRERLRQAGLAEARRRFDWSIVVERHLAVFREVLAHEQVGRSAPRFAAAHPAHPLISQLEPSSSR